MFLTTYKAVVPVFLDGSLVTFWLSGQWSTLPGERARGTNLLLTSSTVQRSTPVLNKRDGLNSIAIDVLSGVAEGRYVRGSGSVRCVSYVIIVFTVQQMLCLIMHYPCVCSTVQQMLCISSARTRVLLSAIAMCIFLLAYCLPCAVLTIFQHTAHHRHFPTDPIGLLAKVYEMGMHTCCMATWTCESTISAGSCLMEYMLPVIYQSRYQQSNRWVLIRWYIYERVLTVSWPLDVLVWLDDDPMWLPSFPRRVHRWIQPCFIYGILQFKFAAA